MVSFTHSSLNAYKYRRRCYPKGTVTNICSTRAQKKRADRAANLNPPLNTHARQLEQEPVALKVVYQGPLKTCKLCHVAKPRTPEFFERCQRYTDGLQLRCKPCLKQVRERNATRRKLRVVVEPGYTLSPDGFFHCTACTGKIYEDLDNEWRCIWCARLVNEPPRVLSKR